MANDSQCNTGVVQRTQNPFVTHRVSCALQEFMLAEVHSQYATMLALMQRAKAEEFFTFTADDMLSYGHLCLQGPEHPHAPSARIAFSGALQLMRSQKEPPCMDKLAMVIILPTLN